MSGTFVYEGILTSAHLVYKLLYLGTLESIMSIGMILSFARNNNGSY